MTVFAGAVLTVAHLETHSLKKVTYDIDGENVPESLIGKRIAMFSDFHNSSRQISVKRIMRKLDEINPLFVLIPGDMIVGNSTNFEPAISLLTAISAKYKVYLAPGNHERKLIRLKEKYGPTIEKYIEAIPENCEYLSNAHTKLEIGDDIINIYGLDINLSYYARFEIPELSQEYIEEKIGKKDDDGYTILLAHNPDYFKEYERWGADLVVSGHNHGGMVRLPILGGVISPRIIFFPEYDRGLYKYNDSNMILTSGIGQHSIKLRLNNKPEICEIRFKG